MQLESQQPIVDPDAPELLRRVELRCEPRRAALVLRRRQLFDAARWQLLAAIDAPLQSLAAAAVKSRN